MTERCIKHLAVAKRLAGRALAERASKGIMKSYKIAEEEAIFDIAWDVALETGCSGFDSYFIALARERTPFYSLMTPECIIMPNMSM